jgi:hypothetical protein
VDTGCSKYRKQMQDAGYRMQKTGYKIKAGYKPVM